MTIERQKKRNWHDYMEVVGMVLMPLAPAVATGWAVYELLWLRGVWLPLAIIAGFAAGLGMELFLALGGETLLTLKLNEDKAWWWVVCIMLVCPVMGVDYYGFNVVGMLFVAVVLFYVVVSTRRQVMVKVEQHVALLESELDADVLQRKMKREQLVWQREQQALQLAHDRELERMKIEQTTAPPPSAPTVLRKCVNEPTADWSQYTRWSDVPEDARRAAGRLDKGDFKHLFAHLSKTTRHRWWGNLEAYRHG